MRTNEHDILRVTEYGLEASIQNTRGIEPTTETEGVLFQHLRLFLEAARAVCQQLTDSPVQQPRPNQNIYQADPEILGIMQHLQNTRDYHLSRAA